MCKVHVIHFFKDEMICFREIRKQVVQVGRYRRSHSFLFLKMAILFSVTGQAARSRPSDRRKKLIKYSAFAWITPAVFVIISVTLDKTSTIIIGYGKSNTLFFHRFLKCFI